VRDEEHVVGDPAVVEAVGPHTGDAALGHLDDVVLRELPPLTHHDRIERVVVGAGAGRRVEIGLRFVQIVHHRRVPLQLRARHRLGQLEKLPHAVAVVVVLDVLAPVHQRQAGIAAGAGLVEVVGVDVFLASVDFNHRRDQRDDVVADVLDERRLLDDQAIGQLDQHFRAAGFRRVHAAHQVVDRLRGLQQRLGLRIGGLARIGQRGELVAVFFERLDRRLIGDRQRDDVAAFLGGADLPVARARRHFRQLLVVAMNVLRVGELSCLPDITAQEFQRRRHGVRRRKMIDQLGRDPRVLQRLLDLRGVLRVDLLRRGL
jgi:hypothetical protein